MNKKKLIYLSFFIFTTITLIGCRENKDVPSIDTETLANISDTSAIDENIPTIDENIPTIENTNTEAIPIIIEPIISKVGSSGDQVTTIQENLKTLGYSIDIDGNYGLGTQKAIQDFQTRNGLIVDGEVGETTLNKLKEPPTDKTKYVPIDYTNFNADTLKTKEDFMNMNTFYSDTNYFIIVNFNRREVNIFEGENKKWKLTNTFSCDIGSPSTPTITGRFRTNLKGTSFGEEKGFRCKYYTQIHEGILFHSIVYNLDGTIQDGRLGIAVSHGCVRLATENAKWIFDYIPKDTQVILK